MFGVGIFEVFVILIVAVIALGPNKLPQAIVDIVKFFRALKKTISEAKESFDKELELSQLKQEALQYKKSINDEIKKLTEETKIDESRQIRTEELTKPINDVKESISKEIQSTLDVLNRGVDYESSTQDSKQDSIQATQSRQDSQNQQSLSYKKPAKSIKSHSTDSIKPAKSADSIKSRAHTTKARNLKRATLTDSIKLTAPADSIESATFTLNAKTHHQKSAKSPKSRAKIAQK